MSDADTQGFPTYSTLITINITFGVTSAINVAAVVKNTQDTINSDTQIHTHTAKIQLIHTSRQPPLSDCLSPSPLVSLSVSLTHTHSRVGYNDTNCRVWRETLLSFRYEERLVSKGQCVFVFNHRGDTGREREIKKESEKERRGEKTE